MRDTRPTVLVECGSRLHFGLLSAGASATRRRFGGLGLMIEAPRTRIAVRPASTLEIVGQQSARVERVVLHWAQQRGSERPRVRIEIHEAPEPHCGWGSGTQLALALVTALEVHQESPPIHDVDLLAQRSGRGERSAVGLYGFEFGGLIVEQGKAAGEHVAMLEERIAWPTSWPIVLLTPRGGSRVFGEREHAAFAELGGNDKLAESQATRVHRELLPAVKSRDFAAFSTALGRFNRQSGELFAEVQGGAYVSPWHQEQVDWLARRGFQGAGQSSWGPTLFAIAPDWHSAHDLARDWESSCGAPADVRVASARNRGRDLGIWWGGSANYGETAQTK